MPRKIPLAAVLALTALLAGCGGLSQSRKSEAARVQQALDLHQQITAEVPLFKSSVLSNYLTRVGQRVARANGDAIGSTRFYLLDAPGTHAFALPGSKAIYIDRGLLPLLASEDELAMVIAHQLAHLRRQHGLGNAVNVPSSASPAASTLTSLLSQPVQTVTEMAETAETGHFGLAAMVSGSYSREQELQADHDGLIYAANAGYAPQAGAKALARLQSLAAWTRKSFSTRGLKPPAMHGIYASAAENLARLQAMSVQASSMKKAALPPEADYLGKIDGMRFGLSEPPGVQRGQKFYDGRHQKLIPVPKGWRVNPSIATDTVAFIAPQSAALVLFKGQRITSGLEPETFVQAQLPTARLLGTTGPANGRKQWRGTADIAAQRYDVTGWIERSTDGDSGYLLLGLRGSPPKTATKPVKLAWPQLYESFSAGLRSLRGGEPLLAYPLVLQIKPAANRASYAALAANAPLGVDAEPLLRLLNGQYPKGEPAKGARLKLVQ